MQEPLSRARLSTLVILLGVVAWLPGAAAGWLSGPRPGTGPGLEYIARPSTPAPDEYLAEPRLPLMPSEQVPEETDIRGNAIVRPVERYGVDHRGSLYELHSPRTELPQLPPPEL
ncbi:MAG TPA: hypothetical protein VNK41_12300 [Vicinamibacterales bacterium]|nr:hypothetical protein [Vicinamibacterales bacterium]